MMRTTLWRTCVCVVGLAFLVGCNGSSSSSNRAAAGPAPPPKDGMKGPGGTKPPVIDTKP
jgi:hypothetical protein